MLWAWMLEWIKKRKFIEHQHALLSLFLTVGTMWPATSCSCCCTHLHHNRTGGQNNHPFNTALIGHCVVAPKKAVHTEKWYLLQWAVAVIQTEHVDKWSMWFLGLWNYFAGRMWKSLQFGGCKSPQSAARRAEWALPMRVLKTRMPRETWTSLTREVS